MHTRRLSGWAVCVLYCSSPLCPSPRMPRCVGAGVATGAEDRRNARSWNSRVSLASVFLLDFVLSLASFCTVVLSLSLSFSLLPTHVTCRRGRHHRCGRHFDYAALSSGHAGARRGGRDAEMRERKRFFACCASPAVPSRPPPSSLVASAPAPAFRPRLHCAVRWRQGQERGKSQSGSYVMMAGTLGRLRGRCCSVVARHRLITVHMHGACAWPAASPDGAVVVCDGGGGT